MATARKPNKKQRTGLAKALLLKRHCAALGIDWDPEVLRDADWWLDDERYGALLIKMGEALLAKVGVKLGTNRDVDSDIFLRMEFDRMVTVDELIDIGRRAGWIDG